MKIRIAETDEAIAACYPVMRALRPHIAEADFVSIIRRQERAGYRLAFVEETGGPVAVAGFRIGENLAWGRHLFVDDLVTLPPFRSKGYGARLLAWLRERAAIEGCRQMHLESGTQRVDAHRFYEREGMEMSSLHFVENVTPDRTSESTPGDGADEP